MKKFITSLLITAFTSTMAFAQPVDIPNLKLEHLEYKDITFDYHRHGRVHRHDRWERYDPVVVERPLKVNASDIALAGFILVGVGAWLIIEANKDSK